MNKTSAQWTNVWQSSQANMATRFVGARDGNFYLEVSALLKSENLWVTSVVNSHGKKNAAIQGFFKTTSVAAVLKLHFRYTTYINCRHTHIGIV